MELSYCGGWSSYVLMKKLKGLRAKIRDWRNNKGTWGVENIKILEEELQCIMSRMENEGANEQLRKNRLEVLNKLWRLYKIEESKWIQKSRNRWLKEGD